MSHGRVVDTTRLATELGWKPKFSTAAAFDDFLRSRDLAGGLPAAVTDLVPGGDDEVTEMAGEREHPEDAEVIPITRARPPGSRRGAFR